ncbi:hypothetical protein ES708_08665 [subsurface metagenome]
METTTIDPAQLVSTEDIIALHNEGLSPSEIAARLGTTYHVVYGRLARAGITPHPAPPPILEIPTEDIIALHEQGLPPGEIAKRLGTTYPTVYERLARAGITPHLAPPPVLEVPTEDIIALHNEGLVPGEIATKLGTTYHVVYERLRGVGITPHLIPLPVPTEDIVDLHNEGLSPTEIAARLNTSYFTAYRRLEGIGLKPHVSRSLRSAKKLLPKIVKLHEEGLSPLQIAEKLGLGVRHVYRHLREERMMPHASAEETKNTLQALDEIIKLAKEGVPRYEIAKRTGSTWPLVAGTLRENRVKPIWPACKELTTWAETLLPILSEIKEAHPNSEPILRKVDELEKEMLGISDATWIVEHSLPSWGERADKERYCVAEVSQPIKSNLADRFEPLKGCVKALDVETLPRKIEQAETCVTGLTDAISRDIRHIPVAQEAMMPKTVAVHSSEEVRVGIGDSVCDKYSGDCGPIVAIMDDEVLIEPTRIKRKVGEKYLETAEPPIRVKKTSLEPDHIRRYEAAKPKEAEVEEADTNKGLLLDILEHESTGAGLVLNPARAEATGCKCFAYDSQEYCWSPGVLGLISSKKNPEQIARFCAVGKTPAGEGVKERFGKIKGAVEEAHREWLKKGEGLPAWWDEVAKSLKKHGVEL